MDRVTEILDHWLRRRAGSGVARSLGVWMPRPSAGTVVGGGRPGMALRRAAIIRLSKNVRGGRGAGPSDGITGIVAGTTKRRSAKVILATRDRRWHQRPDRHSWWEVVHTVSVDSPKRRLSR